jgi:hypothetical protein
MPALQKLLFVTSFNGDLYKASGKNLLSSFKQTKTEGDFFIGYEGIKESKDERPESPWYWYSLSQDHFLLKWLEDNRDIIPAYLGGTRKPCICKDPYSRFDRDHKKGCYFSWWNRNCSRWFRKIACLNYILTSGEFDQYTHMVWVDSDCQFRQTVKIGLIDNMFRGADVFYMKGKKRLVEETGIFGIKLNKYGRFFLEKLIKKYTDGSFRGYVRWDDGYIFSKTRKQYPSALKYYDIGKHSTITDVATESDIYPYIIHHKGTHGRVMGIMK